MSGQTDDQAADAPPAPGTNRVEITVGGHHIAIESPESLSEVIGYAYGLYEQTREAARKIPLGFDVTGGQFERAEPYAEPLEQDWGPDQTLRMELGSARDGNTQRIPLDDPPGLHRAGPGRVPMVPGRAAVPRKRH
jgi:hypothetical protein